MQSLSEQQKLVIYGPLFTFSRLNENLLGGVFHNRNPSNLDSDMDSLD